MSDFTYEGYRTMVAALRAKGYEFADFSAAGGYSPAHRPYALMRHDVDLSLPHAVKLADVEAGLGLTATYFFMVRNDFYNVFSRSGTQQASLILGHGHRLGLHFDCAAYPETHDAETLAEHCAHETAILQGWFGVRVTAVSYHRPQAIVLSGDPRLSHPLPHTYMKRFAGDMKYLSDSHGRWKFGSPLASDDFRLSQPLHILTHPIWWAAEPGDSLEKLDCFLSQRLHSLKRHLSHNCRIYPAPQPIEQEEEWTT